MPHKLLGFELFLARHPEWRGKVVLHVDGEVVAES
jgi:trehalose-6-phosphate synthase